MDAVKSRKEAIIIAAQSSRQPLCVYGPPGCGKSRLINIAWSSKYPDLSLTDYGPVSLNVDESTDAKSLLGSYRSSLTQPGRFEWVDGLLIELIKSGRWLVLEDVEKVSPDILSILPREGDTTFSIAETGVKVAINPGFGLIGTSSCPSVARIFRAVPSWLLLECGYPENLDLILNESLPPIVTELLLKAFVSITAMPAQQGHAERKFGLHDLFRVVNRVKSRLESLRLSASTSFMTDYQRCQIARDLANVFADHSPFPERRAAIVEQCGGESEDKCPAYSSDNDSISLGDSQISRRKECTESVKTEKNFSLTSVHLRMLQRLVRSVVADESVLVVGDTGVGKTSTVQFLAQEMGVKMHVYNFSDQTESSDLMGGLKPVMDANASTWVEEMVSEFEDLVNNGGLPESSRKSGLAVVEYAKQKFALNDTSSVVKAVAKTCRKVRNLSYDRFESRWKNLYEKSQISFNMMKFFHVEGPLVHAVRNGHWILLDEINMAPPDVLRILNGLLDKKVLLIPETGQVVHAHADFRLFAAMNPPHLGGKGKRNLPECLRSRFTEIYFPEVTERSDLANLVSQNLQQDLIPSVLTQVVTKIVDLYLELKTSTTHCQLSSLDGGAPVISLRSLARAMQFAKRLLRSPKRDKGAQAGDGHREIIEGLCVSFSSGIDSRSEAILIRIIFSHFSSSSSALAASALEETTVFTEDPQAPGWVRVQGHWISCGTASPCEMNEYVLTKSVRKNLSKLAVCLAGGQVARPPVLLEGSTGAGKTSLVSFLAKATRHRLIRINNHEHTDLQDYFGQYMSMPDGNLRFQEGPLVTAVRQGHWVLLDELNLAPTEILEALNRLLDDNRELVIPETNEIVKAHPDFILFGTQNPVALEYAGRKSLSRAFRNRFIDVQVHELPSDELNIILSRKCTIAESTASRMLSTFTELSRLRRLDGVLSGKDSALVTVRDLLRWACRGPTTREETALEGFLVLGERLRNEAQKNLVMSVLESKVGGVKKLSEIIENFYSSKTLSFFTDESLQLVPTFSLRRTVALVARAVDAREPVLVVGETGTGKTSAVQMLANSFGKQLVIINCHQHLESADLIGAVCPTSAEKAQKLEWKDGPLIDALRAGHWVLLDEVNLASDSVLERFNSLLDSDYRAVTLAEKPVEETVVAHPEFRLFASMNPGNDFGKKELSAALRNRFTEIWVDAITFDSETSVGFEMVEKILNISNSNRKLEIARKICSCIHFSLSQLPSLNVSSRDALLLCNFVKSAIISGWDPDQALAHAAVLILIDSLDDASPEYLKLAQYLSTSGIVADSILQRTWADEALLHIKATGDLTRLGPFPLPSSTKGFTTRHFSLDAPTSAYNFARLVRAMYGSRRPILLQGDPGAGKSSVVSALAEFCGMELVRINFSDQTELADILGQYVPMGSSFVWKDGILLEAISKENCWVLLDELNLAPQAVLEGLNALLDHRAEIYVPAIDKLVKCSASFRVFATQNEARKGDGRKMLPKSLLSRFNRLRIAQMGLEDLKIAAIDASCYRSVVEKVVDIIAQLTSGEYNLRDIAKLLKAVKLVEPEQVPQTIALILFSRIDRFHEKQAALATVCKSFELAEDSLNWIDPFLFVPSQPEEIFSAEQKIDLLASQAMSVAAVSLALRSGSHVIVTGPSGSGKRSVVRLAAPCEARIEEIRMHSQMDTSDLIGQFVQSTSTSTSSTSSLSATIEFEWLDSPLTSAVRNGGIVCLSNAHCCPPAILDRLNALIEDKGVLVIPEKGQAETIKPHANFRLILLSEKPALLSHAIRNRCVEVHVGSSDLSLYDKVRIGAMACKNDQIVSKIDLVKIASKINTAREMHQAVALYAAGLPLPCVLSFIAAVTDRSYSEEQEIIAVSAITSELSTRQSILMDCPVFSDNDDGRNSVIHWYLSCSVSTIDFSRRLSQLDFRPGPLMHANHPLAKRLFIHLAMTSSGMAQSYHSNHLGEMHALLRNFVPPIPIEPTHRVCYETLFSVPQAIEKSLLIFGGMFRDQSRELFEKLVSLKSIKSIPASVLVELAATAVALGLSRVAHDAETRILSTVDDLIAISDSQLEKQQNDEDSESECVFSQVQQYVDSSVRALHIVIMQTLLQCRVALTEHDLVLFGLERATSEWINYPENQKINETEFAILANKLDVCVEGIVSSIQKALDAAQAVPCGSLPLTCSQFEALSQALSTRKNEREESLSIEEMVQEIVSMELPPFDLHRNKALAVTDLDLEIHQTKVEAQVADICRDVSASGSDGSVAREWESQLVSIRSQLVDSGIYVRPTNVSGTYEKLRYLFSELKKSVCDRIDPKILKSFVRSICGSEFALYRDLTREIGFRVLKLAEAWETLLNVEALRKGRQKMPIPVDCKSLSLSNLLEWVKIEKSTPLLLPEKADVLVKESIESAIAAIDQAELEKALQDEDKVLIQHGVEISIASLVENNDKARADAAVASLRKELFPDTARQFLRELRINDHSWTENDLLVDEEREVDAADGNQGNSKNQLDEWDKVAMLLVSFSEPISCTSVNDEIKRFMGALAKEFIDARPTHGDHPELLALQKIRLDQAVGNIVKVPSSIQFEEKKNQDDSGLVSNREMKLKLREFLRSGNKGINFYSPGGGMEALSQLCPILIEANGLVRALTKIEEISDHPDLEAANTVMSKAIKLNSDCSAICALQAAEAVLYCLEKLSRSIPSRYLDASKSARGSEISARLTQAIARLRAAEVASWKDLRVLRETQFAKSGCGKWLLHLWRLCSGSDNTTEKQDSGFGFDTILSWIRNSGIGQFDFRVALLESVVKLTKSRVGMHALQLAQGWRFCVDSQLATARSELTKQVKALTKEIQFRLGGRHYSSEKFRMDTKRSHTQLASALRRFEESIAERVESVVSHSSVGEKSGSEGHPLATLVEETMDAIKAAPVDKSAKSLKLRLLSDLTSEVKQFLKENLSIDSISAMKDLSAQFVLSEIVLGQDPFHFSRPNILALAMRLCNMASTCQNNDLKPATIQEWRSVCAHALSLYKGDCERQKLFESKKLQSEWTNNSIRPNSRLVDASLVRMALEYVDEAKVVAMQFNNLVESEKIDLIAIEIDQNLNLQLNRGESSQIALDLEFIRHTLPNHLCRVSEHVYGNETVLKLFSSSRSLLEESFSNGMRLAQRLFDYSESHPKPSESVNSTDNEASFDLSSLSEAIEAVLKFTVFLHESGLCSKEEDSTEPQEGGKTDWADGTGLGEGSGVNDKSDEIEDAAQFDLDRNEKSQNNDDDEEDDDDEKTTNKGIEANADQGMNEEDVKEGKKESDENDQEDEDDREMGEVDLSDENGKIDESGAPTQNDEEDEDEGDAKDEVELKNEAVSKSEESEDVRANEKKSRKTSPGNDDQDQQEAEQEGEQEGEEEEGEEDEETMDEKFEAFIDPKDESANEREGDQGEESDVEMKDAEEGIESENENDEQELENGNDLDESDPVEESDEHLDQDTEKIDNNADEEGEKQDEDDATDVEKRGESEEQNKGDDGDQDQNMGSSEEGKDGSSRHHQNVPSNGTEESLNFQSKGADFTKSKPVSKQKGRSAPCPLNPSKASELDKWLEEIKEIVASHDPQEDAETAAGGQTGQQDETSDQTAQAVSTRNEDPSTSVSQLPPQDVTPDKDGNDDQGEMEQGGVMRDDVVIHQGEEDSDYHNDDDDDSVDSDGEQAESDSEKNQSVEKKIPQSPIDWILPQMTALNNHTEPLPPLAPPAPEVSTPHEEAAIEYSEWEANRLAIELCEKLAAVLEPTKRGRLEGYFKTGKKISMRKVLTWIASDYKKNKLWLRRTKPSHREYRVVICLDNTASMRANSVGQLSLVCVSAISQALSLLEVGKVGIMSFGTYVREVIPLQDSSQGGESSFKNLSSTFRFNEESSNSFSEAFPSVIHKCADAFKDEEAAASGGLALVITDGRFDKEKCRPYVQQLIAEGHVPVLIVIDANKDESILSVTSVHFEEEGGGPNKKRKLVRTPFLSQADCPFPFYAVIQDPAQLPATLANILRQWIEISSTH